MQVKINTNYFVLLAFSIAIHPDKVTIATGQVAGHDKDEGKVCQKQYTSINC